MTAPATTVGDNLRRALPQTYEVWYLTWNDPRTDDGFWLRYVIEPSYAELWFARFCARDPARTFGIHHRVDAATSTDAPFEVAIAGARLGHDRATGGIAVRGHDVAWDLRWTPAARTLRLLPDLAYRLGIGETTVVSPNPRVAMSGTLRVDGERYDFDAATMGQTHLWGRRHATSWTWGRCAFDRDAELLELLAVRLERRGVLLPPLVMVRLGDHELNQFRHVAVNRARWEVGRVELVARSTRVRVEVELTCTPADMICAPYLDPDGTEVFCANTEIGDARVIEYRRGLTGWREHRRLVARHHAHFEVGGRTRDPRVERVHELG
jgi:hypothetical protein